MFHHVSQRPCLAPPLDLCKYDVPWHMSAPCAVLSGAKGSELLMISTYFNQLQSALSLTIRCFNLEWHDCSHWRLHVLHVLSYLSCSRCSLSQLKRIISHALRSPTASASPRSPVVSSAVLGTMQGSRAAQGRCVMLMSWKLIYMEDVEVWWGLSWCIMVHQLCIMVYQDDMFLIVVERCWCMEVSPF